MWPNAKQFKQPCSAFSAKLAREENNTCNHGNRTQQRWQQLCPESTLHEKKNQNSQTLSGSFPFLEEKLRQKEPAPQHV